MDYLPYMKNEDDFECSIEFDRDDELFATAGVSKRIKVFEFSTVSKLFQGTCVCRKPNQNLELLKFGSSYLGR